MSCIHISNSNKSRITIRVIELKQYIEILAQSVIVCVRRSEAIRHFSSSMSKDFYIFYIFKEIKSETEIQLIVINSNLVIFNKNQYKLFSEYPLKPKQLEVDTWTQFWVTIQLFVHDLHILPVTRKHFFIVYQNYQKMLLFV